MRTWSWLVVAGFGGLLALASGAACGSNGNGSAGDGGADTSSGGSSGSAGSSGSGGSCFGCGDGAGSSGSGSSSGGGVVCPSGLQCNVQCSGGATTTISGKVYDPALKNPLYDVAVYVPAKPLVALPKGVPMGNDACSCAALFKSGAVVSTATAVDGSFKLTNAPVGTAVPLVLQVGKWRRVVSIDVKSCQDNPQPDKSLSLPGTVAAGDTNDNMPDIAVSTGFADTLECLMTRIGLPTSEYVAGAGGTGHVHVFSGGQPGTTSPGTAGAPEQPSMMGAPESDKNLWDTQAHLMPYDITLLSCEGLETYAANPQALEQYLNAGGRVFASHYHYAFFAGPLITGQSYSAPSDWGTNGSDLAMWHADLAPKPSANGPVGGVIDQTLNGSGQPFPKGQALDQWLSVVSALGTDGVPSAELAIYQPRYNADVGASNKVSQPWITSDSTGYQGSTMYFSFDTPINAQPGPDGGPPNYCGRAVFSDLHVGGNPATKDTPPPPAGCAQADLSPQEKALEFMLFDLSSCVIPDTVPPSDAGVPIVQ